jgi:antitoxin HigA-1
MKPLGLTANRLATKLFSARDKRVNDIVRGRRAITADTALHLARYFGTTPQFWINLQSNYDLELAQDCVSAPAPPHPTTAHTPVPAARLTR